MLLMLPGHGRCDIPLDAVRQAVVKLQGGTGVCVSPEGWIVTAAHMLPGWPFGSVPGPMAKRRLLGPPLPPQLVSTPPKTVAVRFGAQGPELMAQVLAIRTATNTATSQF